ncbi:MAG: RHS repeat protein, partial [Dechloromonas sp.]|nr:RHS repeat protein [Dechloromonas sp.]
MLFIKYFSNLVTVFYLIVNSAYATCSWSGPFNSTTHIDVNISQGPELVNQAQFSALTPVPDLITNCAAGYVEKISTKYSFGDNISSKLYIPIPPYRASPQNSDSDVVLGSTPEEALSNWYAVYGQFNNVVQVPAENGICSRDLRAVYNGQTYINTAHYGDNYDPNGKSLVVTCSGMDVYYPLIPTMPVAHGYNRTWTTSSQGPIELLPGDQAYVLVRTITTTSTLVCTPPRIASGSSCELPPNTLDPKKNLGCNGEFEGNPCNAGTGNKFQVERDYIGSGPFALSFMRYYNGGQVERADLGDKWRHSFSRSIAYASNGVTSSATLKRPDGSQYSYSPQGGGWVSDQDVVGKLYKISNGWIYLDSNNNTELYDSDGLLINTINRNGVSFSLSYAPFPKSSWGTTSYSGSVSAQLASVADPFGRQITFLYFENQLAGMTNPAGGKYRYAFNGDKLITASFPSGVRTYLYNETGRVASSPSGGYLLTGLIDENNNRYASWSYDSLGRVYVSEHGLGIDKINISFDSDNQTSVTDAIGSQRTHQFLISNGSKKRAATLWPQISANSQITYDANGNVASQMDLNGVNTTYGYDLSRNLETSRVEASGKPEARTTITQWHPYWRLPTQVAEPKKLSTWVYNGDGGVYCAPTTATVP